MNSAQVVERSVNVTSNRPSQNYIHPDDRNLSTYDVTPVFKPFTVKIYGPALNGIPLFLLYERGSQLAFSFFTITHDRFDRKRKVKKKSR